MSLFFFGSGHFVFQIHRILVIYLALYIVYAFDASFLHC